MRKIHLIHCLLLSIGLLLLAFLPSCDKASAADNSSAVQTLYVVSPHGVPIRKEFARAFEEWHKEKYGVDVKIDWPDRGGTEQIKKYLAAQYARSDSSGYDVMFGGGSGTFDDLAAKGFLQPVKLPAEVLAAIPQKYHGTMLRAEKDIWIAAALSFFGIIVNENRVNELGIKDPETWEDLTNPEWFGLVSVADPSKSGSVRTSYEMLLQQYGWEKGWPILVKIFANAEAVRDSGSAPADEVGTANAAAGIVIDFFAGIQITKQGESIVKFIVPKGGSAIDADPIAVLKGSPHADIANHFVEFVVTPPGQKLWVYKLGAPGGPTYRPLRRMSILPEVYDHPEYLAKNSVDPFTAAAPLQMNRELQKNRSVFLGELVRVTLIENHDLLVAARKAVHDKGDPPELLARFDALPTVLVDGKPTALTTDLIASIAKRYSTGEAEQLALKTLWSQAFADNLHAILNDARLRFHLAPHFP